MAWKYALGKTHEMYGFAGLSIIWIGLALVAAVGNPMSDTSRVGNVVLACSWINIFTHVGSGWVSFVEARIEAQEG